MRRCRNAAGFLLAREQLICLQGKVSVTERLLRLYRQALVSLFFATVVAMSPTTIAAESTGRYPVTVTPSRNADQQRLPAVLSDNDAAIYRELFSLARQQQWQAIDDAAAGLHDTLLLGHVLSLRYVGSAAVPALPDEISGWLAAYGDHPQAQRVAALLYPGLSSDGRGPEIESSGLWSIYKAANGYNPSSRATPDAWKAGLAAWRAADYQTAAANFEVVASRDDLSVWTQSAGAFWAARAYLLAEAPQQVVPWLVRASSHTHTFYGLMARHILGLPMAFDWTLNGRDMAALRTLYAADGGRRALALLEVEEPELAESELKGLVLRDDIDLAHGAMIVADAAGMAEAAMKLARMLRHFGIDFQRAAFPIPRWAPHGGFTTDRALVYALMRQESTFNPRAVSSAGARGVMQIMPATARYVARRTGVGSGSVSELVQPESNMALGQSYLGMLLADDNVGPDLFRLAAAWNGGPGNLGRWTRDGSTYNDPLLFIETIPLAETRDFIERVLANLWIYRYRLGEPTPSLAALAAGNWPGYDGAEASPVEVAEHGRD
jgi:soluble lytic murein transglycosylase-like protein